jgi:galactokinase
MTGGGFGGSTINLVEAEAAEEFARQLGLRYLDKTGLVARTYVTRAAGGACEV